MSAPSASGYPMEERRWTPAVSTAAACLSSIDEYRSTARPRLTAVTELAAGNPPEGLGGAAAACPREGSDWLRSNDPYSTLGLRLRADLRRLPPPEARALVGVPRLSDTAAPRVRRSFVRCLEIEKAWSLESSPGPTIDPPCGSMPARSLGGDGILVASMVGTRALSADPLDDVRPTLIASMASCRPSPEPFCVVSGSSSAIS
mmetsp:Transcript_55964/g.132780  ORF Transcript_55964/g.132780 Transcript_55964/m.132780 type:complete len:203 (-) Transcript_55964:1084-1692(-)